MWVSVPKNANMTMRKLCESVQMVRREITLDNIPKSTEVFAIIRNPKTRILSGLAECSRRSKNAKIRGNTDIKKLLEMLISDIRIFDEHLEPQCYYLQHHTFTNFVRFENLDTNLLMLNYFQNKKIPIRRHINPKLLGKSRKSMISDMDTLVIENRDLLDQCIKKYYQTDQDLYRNPESYINKPMQRLMPYE
jgi:hypothetical protein